MMSHAENYSFDEREPEISQVKGGPGIQTGGTPSGQSGGHLSPGGDCFAPLFQKFSQQQRVKVTTRSRALGETAW